MCSIIFSHNRFPTAVVSMPREESGPAADPPVMISVPVRSYADLSPGLGFGPTASGEFLPAVAGSANEWTGSIDRDETTDVKELQSGRVRIKESKSGGRRWLPSRLSSKRVESQDQDRKDETALSTQLCHSTPLLGQRRPVTTQSVASIQRRREELHSASLAYSAQIQRCRRSQTLRSRQLALSEMNRMRFNVAR